MTTFKSVLLVSGLLASSVLGAGVSRAEGSDPTQRNQILAEIHQVRTGDYSYQVSRTGQRVERAVSQVRVPSSRALSSVVAAKRR